MTTMLEGATIEHPFSIHSAPFGTTRIPRGWKYVACLLLAFVLGIGNAWGAEETITWDGTSLTGVSSTNITAGTALAVAGSDGRKVQTIEVYNSTQIASGGTTRKKYNDGWWEDFYSTPCTTSGCTDASTTARIEIPFTIGASKTFEITSVSFDFAQNGGSGPAVHAFLVQGTTEEWLGYKSATGTCNYTPTGITFESGEAKLVFVLGIGANKLGDNRGFLFSNISITGDVEDSGAGPVAVTAITIAPSSATIKVGKTVKLTPTITPSNATDKTVTWAVTSGGSYASVTDAGVVTGLAAGTAVVTATAHDGSGVTQTATITVEACPASGTIYKFQLKTDLTNGNLTTSVPQDVVMTTENYLSNLTGGTLTAAARSNVNRINISNGNAIGFANGADAFLKMDLDCAIQEGDILKYTITSNDMILMAGSETEATNRMTLSRNVAQVEVDSKLVGADALYMKRSSSSPKISYFEVFRPVYNTITLEYADGVTPDGTIKVLDGEAATKPSDPTWAHHRFDGWYNGASPYDWTAAVSDDLTLTAHWTQLYTITYANGDAGATGDAPTQVDKAATETFKVAANTFELAGKLFDYWTDGVNNYNPDDTYTVGTSNVTLTAVWRTPATMYAITKGDHDNGDFTIDPATQEAGGTVTLSVTPAEDYLFSAWEVVKTEDGSATGITVDANGQFEMPAYAVTVNATFVADTRAKILYLTTTSEADTKSGDKLYAALKDAYNVKIAAPDGQTLTNYDLIILHESIGGTNTNSAVTGCKTTTVPVLNTKSYFYNNANTSDRWGWGTPNAGQSVKGCTPNAAYCNIADHPIFDGVIDEGFVEITDEAAAKCMQPIGAFTTGKEGYTLATTPNASEGNGCAIHELTPAQRGVVSGKYLMISVSNAKLNALNANGQKLFQNAVAYLLDGSANWAPVVVPTAAAIAADPSIAYSVGDNIELTASATGVSATTTYTWYKGATLEAAIEAGAVQAAETAANDGNVYTKASCALGDAGTYWCVISNGTGCEVSASLAITVSDISYDIAFVSAHGTAPTATTGVSYTLPELSASGWEHQGWTASIDVTVDAATVTAGTKIANGKIATFGADVTFTAVWTQVFDVTFNLQDHGAAIDAQHIVDGGKVTKPADPSETDWNFGGWYKEAGCTNAWDFANDVVTEATVLYAKWTADPCGSTERKSLSKVVLTATDDGTVSGYNDGEYAGSAVIAGLDGTQTAEVDGSHEGVETGYKMNGKGSAIVFATLKKGTFQEGDKVVFTITKKNDVRAVDEDKNILTIYYGTNASDATELTTIKGVSAAGTYTYRLTAADVTAIGSKKGIGLFRVSGDNGQNPYVYSVEITGCRNWTVMRTVSFDMGGHGSAIADLPVEDGEKISAPAEPEAEGYLFQGWYKENTFNNLWDFANDVVEADITLYAKWVADPCSDRQSLSKVVLTSKTEGTVSGYNSKEYAGDAVIGGLNETQTAEVDDSHEGTETGYKLAGSGTGIVFATLAKGTFQEGDKVVVTITKQQDAYKVEEVAQPILDIYYGTNKDDATFLATIDNVTAAGTYTYRLTAADVTAIGDKKGIGVFRPSSGRTQNPYVYSVEITGCRDWSASHDVTFNMHDHGSAIAAQSVYEGGKVTKPAVVEPEGWAFDGWYKESTYENEWDFDLDVMGTSDIELHAKWESEVGVIKLFNNTGDLNTTNFISAAKTTIEINEVEYPTLADFGSNRTSLSQAKQADMVMYSATTDATKIKFELYNANGSAKSAYLWLVEEGDAAATAIDVVEVPGNERLTTSYYTFNGTKNRSFYLTSGSKADIKVMQVKVMDNGTAIPQFGKAGYSVDFNKGRIAVASNGTVSFEGASIHSNDEYSVLNNESIKPKTYIQFNNAVANTTVKIKKASSNKYYVTNDLDNKGTEYSTDQEIVLTTTGTWYIGSVNSGSVAALSKIEFIAPKCEAPAFNALANSDICSGDAYVALDGTGIVSDGGSISYKWYADGDAENVLATTATYTPEADGSYYVVALHHVDGYTDNEVTSDVVTVTTHAGTAISEPLADQRGNVDDVVALEVVASGKNLHYAWKECATIDGEYTAVAGAADAASLDVTITEGMDKYYKVIVSSDCGDAQESVAHVTQYVPVAQANVTGSIAWDWANAASVSEIKLTTTSTPKKNEGFVMANGAATIYNNANFESDKLYLEGEYIVRDGDKANPYFQGQTIKFNTTVAGAVRVKFSHTGNSKPARELYINGVGTGDSRTSATAAWSRYVEVPAGEVSITAYHVDPADGAGQQYIRVPEIEFYALDQVRDDSWIAPGELGTVCYPNGHIVVGADMYQMAGVDENHKFAFDQVTVTEPGVPYLFEATGYDPIKFYKTTAAAAAEAGTSNGMVGTFVAMTLSPAEGENLYYFQGTHFYSVADRTKNLSVPANRCYVDLNEPHPAAAPAPGRRRITFGVNGTNTATGVENIQTTEISIQKVLIDGKMYILRGEKMYDATGRLVK